MNGFLPPERKAGFSWCDLRCGHGVTAAMLAATHPTGIFHGVDIIPDHIVGAQRLAEEAAITNVSFLATDFTDAKLELSHCDYIVAQGIYSWISPAKRTALTAFIARHLKPGGLAFVSYDAMPDHASNVASQKLLKVLSHTFPGNSVERLEAAAKVVRAIADFHVPALKNNSLVADLDPKSDDYSAAYLAHAFTTNTWHPFFVTEIRSLMADVGLEPVGTAELIENYDDYVLGQRARQILSDITDNNVRDAPGCAGDVFVEDGGGYPSFRQRAVA